jgi:hypothetical protein
MQVETKYATDDKRYAETGMAISLGKDPTGTFGISFLNSLSGYCGFVLFTREDLAELRDALNRELAS